MTEANAYEGPVEAQFGDYIALLKPRVMSLVVFTAFVGLWVAPGQMDPFLAFCSILFIAIGGILVASRGSSAQVMCCDNYLMQALAAVFVGRSVGGAEKPNALGTLVGAMLVSTLENGLTICAVPYYILPAVKGAVLALALMAAYAGKKEQ